MKRKTRLANDYTFQYVTTCDQDLGEAYIAGYDAAIKELTSFFLEYVEVPSERRLLEYLERDE